MSTTDTNKSWGKFLILFFFISNLFWIGGVVVNFKITPYKEIRRIGFSAKKLIKSAIQGNEGTKVSTQLEPINEIIESSVLPLKKKYFSLDNFNIDFGTARLRIINDEIIILDSLGTNLSFDGQQVIDKEIKENVVKTFLKRNNKIEVSYALNSKGHEELFLYSGKNNSTNKSKAPFFAFVPPIGITSIIQLADFHERWNDNLLIATSEMQSLYRLKLVENRVVFSEPIWIGDPILDIVQNKNNIILLSEGKLIVLNIDLPTLKKNIKGNNMLGVLLPKCANCHQFTPTTPLSMAPSLENIFSKKIGADPLFKRYTPALNKYEGVWNEENLSSYLKNPATLIPGTSMPALGLTDDEVDEIIAVLSNPLRK